MPEIAPARGSYAKSVERRREILDAGLEVFGAYGFRRGSIREIAKRVGMSQAGLLHHFSSKSDLLAAVLDRRDERSSRLLAGRRGIDLIRGLLNITIENQRVPGLVSLHCVLSAEATDPGHPAHTYFRNRYAFVRGTSTAGFEDMLAAGQLREGGEPASLARMLTALMDGLQVQWLLDPDRIDMEAEIHTFLRSVSTVDI